MFRNILRALIIPAVMLAAAALPVCADTLWVGDGNSLFYYYNPSQYVEGPKLLDPPVSEWHSEGYVVDVSYFDPAIWGWGVQYDSPIGIQRWLGDDDPVEPPRDLAARQAQGGPLASWLPLSKAMRNYGGLLLALGLKPRRRKEVDIV